MGSASEISPQPVYVASGKIFKLTQGRYTDKEVRHRDVCASEFGDNHGVADWVTDLRQIGATHMPELCDALGIETSFNSKHFFVTSNGKSHIGSRAYFFERHDGKPPGNWLVHDQLSKISLGSWFGIKGPALCVVAAPSRSSTESRMTDEKVPEVTPHPVFTASGKTFKLTQGRHTDKEVKHRDACASEFGTNHQVADWVTDLRQLGGKHMADLCDALGIETSFNSKNFFVTSNGKSHIGSRA